MNAACHLANSESSRFGDGFFLSLFCAQEKDNTAWIIMSTKLCQLPGRFPGEEEPP